MTHETQLGGGAVRTPAGLGRVGGGRGVNVDVLGQKPLEHRAGVAGLHILKDAQLIVTRTPGQDIQPQQTGTALTEDEFLVHLLRVHALQRAVELCRMHVRSVLRWETS